MKDKILIVLVMVASIFAKEMNEENTIGPLLQDTGWRLTETFEDGVRLYEKIIPGLDLKAYRVEVDTEINGSLLLQSFESVDKYPSILVSAKNITFDTIEQNDEYIKAYQHIDIPFISNRQYFYRLFKNNGERDYSWWSLAERNLTLEKLMLEKHRLDDDVVYLNKGAGVYRVIRNEENSTVHYSLFLDPEGSIPGFMANRVNRSGLVNMFRDLLQYSKQNRDG
ncbi:MAG: hypothetical protein JXQ65_01450 [Candidatus Marinimicrobia bacterium]|nr:hypothetical protein [Candidatus Neomarinimicrobiota bacterium]